MKKTLLIILSIILILVGGVWVYLMLYGTPGSAGDVFADLGFGGGAPPTEFVPPPTETDDLPPPENTAIDTSAALNQLTIRPVAGAVIVGSSSTPGIVRYTEKGIGHVYEIDLNTNEERRLPSETRALVDGAIWSPNGQHVVQTFELEGLRQVVLMSYSSTSDSFTETTLPPDAREVSFSDNTTLHYVRSDADGAIAYRFDVPSGERTVWFNVPFQATAINWSSEPLIYPRPGEGYPSFAYRYSGGELQRVSISGVGLIALDTPTGVVITRQTESGFRSTFLGTQSVDLGVSVFPEKCAAGTSSERIWCAAPLTLPNADLPFDWYKGVISMTDLLWEIDLTSGSALLTDDLSELSGVMIDVENLSSDTESERLIFTDKNTDRLWLYDTTAIK